MSAGQAPTSCPFCSRIATGEALHVSALAVAFRDGYPVSPGHTLIVPRRHVEGYFDLSADEQAEVWRMANLVREDLDRDTSPSGYNLGVNVGAAAGQTVAHAHVHLIPRYEGDVADPRGGVRWVLPARADYWSRRP